MSEIMTASYRDINTITAEIKLIRSNVQKVALEGAIEIGRRLVEAKDMLAHGEWGPWLKAEFEYSQPTASRFMTLFKEYGKEQGSLFGAEAKYSTLNSLEISKALLLVAIPEEERESFASENKIEDISTRELEKLIKEKQEAEERAARAEKALESAEEEKREAVSIAVQGYEETISDIQKLLGEAESATKTAEGKVKAAEKDAKAAEKARQKLATELVKAREEAEGARRDLQELRDNPEIPEEIMEKLRAQFGKAAEEAEAKAAELEKKLSLAAPELTEFQMHMQNVQRELEAMEDVISRVSEELGAKLRRAARAVAGQMLERMGEAG